MKNENNNKMLSQFLEKVNNCKNDVDLSYSSMNSKEYSLTFNDFYGFDEEWNELQGQIEDILNKESGVYGISTISVDFRDIEREALGGGIRANRALDAFHYDVAAYVAKCAVAMGGIDVLTFTAGVGEKSSYSRSEICKNLKLFGVEISEELNNVRGEEKEISTTKSKVKVFIVPTNEELMIARETEKIVK